MSVFVNNYYKFAFDIIIVVNKPTLVIILIATVLIVGYIFIPKNTTLTKPSSETSPTPIQNVPYEATLTGEYTCLPHKNTNGPQTMECAFGIKTSDGSYYALDMSKIDQQESMTLQTQTKITAQGTLVPVEQLSSDHWQKYNIRGILQVNTLNKE